MINGFFILYGLVMILVILIVMKLGNRKTPCNYQTADIKINVNYESFMNHLEWQFQMGLISVQEYNKMHMEALPFLNGVE